MFDHSSVREGMLVRSSDGEKLGKVVAVSERSLRISKGGFFSNEYTALLTDVREIRGDELTLALDRAALRSGNMEDRERDAPDTRDLGTIAVARDSMHINSGQGFGTHVVERSVGVSASGGSVELRSSRMDLPTDGGWSEELTQYVSTDPSEERNDGRAPDTAVAPERGDPLERP